MECDKVSFFMHDTCTWLVEEVGHVDKNSRNSNAVFRIG